MLYKEVLAIEYLVAGLAVHMGRIRGGMSSPDMIVVVGPSSKALAAVMADVRPITCVAPNVYDQIRISLKHLSAARFLTVLPKLRKVVRIGTPKLLLINLKRILLLHLAL